MLTGGMTINATLFSNHEFAQIYTNGTCYARTGLWGVSFINVITLNLNSFSLTECFWSHTDDTDDTDLTDFYQ